MVYFADIVIAVCASPERAEQAIAEDDMVPERGAYTVEEMQLLT